MQIKLSIMILVVPESQPYRFLGSFGPRSLPLPAFSSWTVVSGQCSSDGFQTPYERIRSRGPNGGECHDGQNILPDSP